ncbi:MAG: DUF488 domain-containing protein [Agriterribacter sp.]
MNTIINIRRIYEEPLKTDGARILVDRLWPRGLSKENAAVDEWAKNLAPTTELRKWFDHSSELWPEFRRKYTAELKANEEVAEFVKKYHDKKKITLLYAAKSEDYNNAVVLKQYLEKLW